MKANIITIFDLSNYGNRLQNYAVSQVLKDLEVSNTTIALDPVLSRKQMLKNKVNDLTRDTFSKDPAGNRIRRVRKDAFKKWTNQYIPTAYLSSMDEIPDSDLFVLGGDQILNPNWFYVSNQREKLALMPLVDKPKICFAPSFGISKLPDKWKLPFKNGLSRFYALNCREAEGAALMEELTGKKAEVWIDPVMLVDIEKWRQIEKRPENLTDRKYVACNFLGKPDEQALKMIEELKKEGYEIIWLADARHEKSFIYDPSEFLYILDHASLVLTDSFHCSVFAFMMDRPFRVFKRDGKTASMFGRLQNLADRFELQDCLYVDENSKNWKTWDYSKGHEILKAERKRVIDSLKQSLEDIEQGRAEHDGYEHFKALLAINTDNETRKNSSSGGLFYPLASKVIEQGGVVFGAVYDDEGMVVHTWTESLEGLKAMQGSKYTKSRQKGTYGQVKNFLDQGRLVYFSGVPCEAAALKMFLKKDYDNLIIQDTACHGTPDPKIYKAYRQHLEKEGGKIEHIQFRDKSSGWKHYSIRFDQKERVMKQPAMSNLYMKGFVQDVTLLPACFTCTNKGLHRPSDITLADAWGVSKLDPDMDDDLGTSLVLVHSKKGQDLLDSISSRLHLKEVSPSGYLKANPALISTARKNVRTARFEKALESQDVISALKMATAPSKKQQLKKKVKTLLGK